MRVFIAGSTGVLGRRVVRRLREKGHDVVGLVRNEKLASAVRNLGGTAIVGNIFDANSMVSQVGSADVVVHAATSIPTKLPGRPEDWAMNDRLRREGTQALTEAAAKLGASTYIQQSVVWVNRPPNDSFYDETTTPDKPDELYRSAFDAEQIAREAGEKHSFNVSILRGAGFYAADAAHTRLFAEALVRRRLPIIGDGNAISANIHVDDAAEAYVTAIEQGKHGTWHITDDDPTSLNEMFTNFADLLGTARPWKIPLWLAKLFMWHGVIEFFTRSTRTSNALFKRDFGWSPRYPSYRAGLVQIVSEWRGEGFINSGGAK